MPRSSAMLAFLLLTLVAGRGLPRHAAAAEDRPAAPPPLRWAADAEGGAPYIFNDPNHVERHIGFEVDVSELLAKELGRRIEFRQYAFVNLMSGLQRRDFDLAMNGLEVTPDREQVIRFSRPYYIFTLQLVARVAEQRFDSLESCGTISGVVGTLGDTAAERTLDRMRITKKVYSDQVSPYQDLKFGRLDAVLLDLPIAVYYAQPDPALKFVGPPREKGAYAIGFHKEDQALAAQCDAALERLLSSGQLRRVYEKWRIWNDQQNELFRGLPTNTAGSANVPQGQPTPAEDAESMGDVVQESSRRWTFVRYFPMLLQGAVVTVGITLASMALAVLLGLPLALMRLYGPLPLRILATLYVEFFRGIPVLLLLWFLYYGLPTVSEYYGLWFTLKLGPLQAAILGFGLNYAAYEAEIYRSGIRSIPVGQWEAAAALGMSPPQTFRRIILPQAIRVILPPMTNDLVALFKDTSIVSVIAVVELTKQYQILSNSSLKYLEIGLATAALYLVMSVPLGYLSRDLEKRWGKGT
ncbi:MAG: ABC transporter substrate-binding protein/permease [Planctomycetota bacterium]|nr:ABC transporter substrate-binding protein/permease [Planctomycetota bacterium]